MVGNLTEKELKILKLRYEGLKNKEIALKLGFSEPDVSQTLSRAVRRIATVDDTLATMYQLGVIKNDVEIELTEKGKEILGNWQEIWRKDFKSRQCAFRREIIVSPKKSKTVTASENAKEENQPSFEDMNKTIKELSYAVYEMRDGIFGGKTPDRNKPSSDNIKIRDDYSR